MAVQGDALFLDASDGDEIDWTNPASSTRIFVRVDDTDLDVPVKKVIYTDGTSDVTVQPGTVTTTGTTALEHSTSTGLTLAVDDTVLIKGETVRKVTARSGTSTTVNVAFTNSTNSATAYKVTNTSASFDSCPDCTAANNIIISVSDGLTKVIDIADLFDLLDSNVSTVENRFSGDLDTRINKQDIRIDLADGNNVPSDITFSVDLSNGQLTLANAQGGATGNASSSIAILYWFADNNNTQDFVNVSSEADEDGLDLTLTEIQTTGGAFEIEIGMCRTAGCSSATTSPVRIEVGDNDVLTVLYEDPDDSDATGTVTVEATLPGFGNEDPVDLFATIASRPNLSIDVTDADSGIAVDSDDIPDIQFVMRTTELNGTVLDSPRTEDEPAESTISGGYNVQTLVPRTLTPDEDVYLIEWWVVAVDVAGNRSVSDNLAIEDSNDEQTECDPAEFDLDNVIPGTTTGACDPFQVRVDLQGPTFDSATTGNYFDTVAEAIASSTDAIKTSIQVEFNEALDEDSIDLADFDSDDIDITGVNWYAEEPKSVFLTTDAMDAADEPTIDLVGSIEDEAGNVSDSGDNLEVDSDDGIPATLTVTVTGVAASQPITDQEITITVVSDEALLRAPTVTTFRLGDRNGTTSENTRSVSLTATRTWEATFDLVSAGLYTVLVEATDLGSGDIESTVGLEGGIIEPDDEDGFFFEVDNEVAAATFPLTENDTNNPDTFISIDFSNEANEYGLTTGDIFTVNETLVDESHDTHDTLTLISFTLDDVDVTADVSTTDNLVFLYKASGLSLGEHVVKYEVEDEVENTSGELEHTFDVTERAEFEVPLVPGWNMISIPGDPADTAIDAVIGTDVPITAVYGYDPSIVGGWLTAVREADDDGNFGAFAGTLTTINPNLGYWVLTSTFEPISVDIPQLTAGAATVGVVLPPQPPSIDIVVGWNLIAVRDVTSNLDAAPDDQDDWVTGTDSVDSDVYLAGLEISRVLHFDTLTNAWQVIVPDGELEPVDGDNAFDIGSDDDLGVGNAYWLFATLAGTLVP